MTTDNILSYISEQTSISIHQVKATIALLDDGATIPFISRYRKEKTGSLNETQIQTIALTYEKAQELDKRKQSILSTIEQQGKLTNELRSKIEAIMDANELEDAYLPYKPKRRTKAEIAREAGLEPLAKIIMAQRCYDIQHDAKRFINNKTASIDEAIAGACDIIAEWISENTSIRNIIRKEFDRSAVISCKPVKGKEEEAANYQNYFNYTSPLKRCASYRILAMRRGEKEGLLQVSIDADKEYIIPKIEQRIIRNQSPVADILRTTIADSYKRLLKPSIENEFAASSKETADDSAISLFADNARQLLFAPPLGKKRVLAIDPGYRTGCKVVCLDEKVTFCTTTPFTLPHHAPNTQFLPRKLPLW